MIGEYAGDVFHRGVGEGRRNGCEGFVGGRKDSEVRGLIDGIDEVCGVEGAVESGEVGREGGLRDANGQGKDRVDDVDNTTGEVDILCRR